MKSRIRFPIFWVLVLLLVLSCGGAESNEAQADAASSSSLANLDKRWLLIQSNLILADKVAEASSLLERAKKAGYNGIVLSDTKNNTWFKESFRDTWLTNAQALRDRAAELELSFAMSTLPYGYCGPLLSFDPNLATGTPVRDAPLQVQDGKLVALSTAELMNGGLESAQANTLDNWFQDEAGEATFIDTSTFQEGSAALRIDAGNITNEFGHGRLIQKLSVTPFQQYRLVFWVKTENLSANHLGSFIKAVDPDVAPGEERQLLSQEITLLDGDSLRSLRSVNEETLPWTKVALEFNSLDANEISVALGVWGATQGTAWLDGVKVESVPLLNVLRRDALPISLNSEPEGAGQSYTEGQDFEAIVDPALGNTPYGGKYDTAHPAPQPTTQLAEGSTVYYSGYHAHVSQSSHVACSLSDPALDEVARRIITENEAALAPDAYFLGHSEIRSGGWEAEDQGISMGEALADNVRRITNIIESETGKPIVIWGDMFDPAHNAKTNYYQVGGDLAGSWEGLSENVMVVPWWEGAKIDASGAATLQFFAERGHPLIIGGYYNDDTTANYESWAAAVQGVPIDGAMFATWNGDFSELETFAELWWGGGE